MNEMTDEQKLKSLLNRLNIMQDEIDRAVELTLELSIDNPRLKKISELCCYTHDSLLNLRINVHNALKGTDDGK